MFQGDNVKDENAEQALSLSSDRLLLQWKQLKRSMLMELCLAIVPNNPMGDRHILRRCTRASRHGCASPSIAGRKVGPRSTAIPRCNWFLLCMVTRIRGVYGKSIAKTFFCPLESALYYGIPNFGSCSQRVSILRCQVRFKTWQKGGN